MGDLRAAVARALSGLDMFAAGPLPSAEQHSTNTSGTIVCM